MDDLTAHVLSVPTHQHKKQLHQKLVKYRSSKCPWHSTASLMIGTEQLTGLSDKLIKEVVERCMEVNDVNNVHSNQLCDSRVADSYS